MLKRIRRQADSVHTAAGPVKPKHRIGCDTSGAKAEKHCAGRQAITAADFYLLAGFSVRLYQPGPVVHGPAGIILNHDNLRRIRTQRATQNQHRNHRRLQAKQPPDPQGALIGKRRINPEHSITPTTSHQYPNGTTNPTQAKSMQLWGTYRGNACLIRRTRG